MYLVYFIRTGDAVKIGWTANLSNRLKSLQRSNPQDLQVIRTLEGRRQLETLLHRYFSSQRIRGEWFTYSDKMLTITPQDVEITPGELTYRPHDGKPLFRQWREKNNLTQDEAAEALGYGDRRIRAYDLGEEVPPLVVRLAMSAIDSGFGPIEGIPYENSRSPSVEPEPGHIFDANAFS